MNDGYLDAECVITFLQEIGLVRPKVWKHENPPVTELYYPIQFFQTARAAMNPGLSNKYHIIPYRIRTCIVHAKEKNRKR
jgi:hypothetical protein